MSRWVEKEYEIKGRKGKLETLEDSRKLIDFMIYEMSNINTIKSLYDLNVQTGIIMGYISMLKMIEVIDENSTKNLSEVLANVVSMQEAKIIGELKKENKE
jgi:hypothetical protein